MSRVSSKYEKIGTDDAGPTVTCQTDRRLISTDCLPGLIVVHVAKQTKILSDEWCHPGWQYQHHHLLLPFLLLLLLVLVLTNFDQVGS